MRLSVRREWRIAGIIALASAAWRLSGLGYESLWTDEIAAILVSGRSLLEVLATIGIQDVNPPFFYLLLHFWLWGGDAEWWVRLLPAVCGSGLILLVWRLGRRLFGPRVGLLGGLFAAFSPVAVYLSRELRYHTLVAVLAAAAFLWYRRLMESERRADRVGLTITLVLGMYTHYFFLFVPTLLLIWHRLDPQTRMRSRRPLLRPLLISFICFLPWLLFMAVQVMRGTYQSRPLSGLGTMLADLALYATFWHADGCRPVLNRIWPILLLAPFGVLLLAGLRDRRPGRSLAAIGFFGPAGVTLVAALMLPVYGHRYLLPFLPFLWLLFAAGAAHLDRRRRFLGTVLALAALAVMTAGNLSQRLNPQYQREDWRGLAAYLRRTLPAQDLLLAYSESQAGPLVYYWRKQSGEEPVYRTLISNPATLRAPEDPAEIESRVELYRRRAERLWLLDHFAHLYDPAGVGRAALEERCVRDVLPDLESLYRIPVRVYWPDRRTADAAAGPRYASRLDFGEGGYDRLQLGSGWTHVDEPWAWLGEVGEIFLRADQYIERLDLRVRFHPEWHHREALALTLAVNGVPGRSYFLSGNEPQTLTYRFLESVKPETVLAIRLRADHTFDPAVEIGGADHTPKSVMVDWLELR